MNKKEIYWHPNHITKNDRNKLLGFNNKVIWFTGLSGSGKSTISYLLEKALYEKGISAYALDGDNIRHGINSNLGFSESDRNENIRRVKEVTKLFYDSGLFVLVSFISPYKKGRAEVRQQIGEDFVEVYVECPIAECEKRDVKGLYKKAKEGLIKDFTGISAPYEAPESPEIVINTSNKTPDECVNEILNFLGL